MTSKGAPTQALFLCIGQIEFADFLPGIGEPNSDSCACAVGDLLARNVGNADGLLRQSLASMGADRVAPR